MSELITRKDQSHNIPRRYAYAKDFGDIISNFLITGQIIRKQTVP